MRFVLLPILLCAVSAAPVVRVKECPVVLPTDATPRIVGGNDASPRTRSHVVSFYEEGCGGSLLSDVWVLTAAHCLVHDRSIARISGTNSSNGVEIPVKRVFDHPAYEFPTNDISLVELEFPAPPSASFMAVNSNPSIPEDGEYARVAGYGFQEEGFDLDHDALLRQVDVPVMNTQKCIDRYFSVNSYLRENIDPTKHICAGYDVGGCDSCTADSGGPLFLYDSQNTPMQIAIVSFGYGCAREVPGGYTRVSTYVPWMKSVGAVFGEKTARVAKFGNSVSGADEDDTQTEETEEQINEIITDPLPEQQAIPSPAAASEAVSSSVPVSLEPGSSTASPEATEFLEAPSTPQESMRPSPPARLPPHHAVNPLPYNDKPSSSGSQGGHGGEGKPKPDISGSAPEESPSTDEGEDRENTVSTDGYESDAVPSNASDGETEEYEPEELDTNPASNEDSDNGSGGDTAGENETSNSAEDAPASSSLDPNFPAHKPDVHRPAPPKPDVEQESENEQFDQSESDSASEGENSKETSSNGGSETESDEFTQDGGETGTENESNYLGENETNGPVEVPGSGDIGSGPENPVGPISSSAPSPGPFVPPSETISEGFEELEPSGSPEVTESPDATSSDFDAEGGSLGALPITLIAIGSVLILSIVSYLIYYFASRRAQ